jgi:hypothetical protein
MKKLKFTIKKGLTLGKKTISNLNEMEMNLVGGQYTFGCYWHGKSRGCSKNGNSCAGHNTCQYTCV